jgi:ice-binding like protein
MTRLTRPLITLTIAVSALVIGAWPMAALAFTAPGLGTAASYAILAGTPKITNTGDSVISGSVGIWPAEAVTGFPPGIVINGTIQAGTDAAKGAQSDLTTAYLYTQGLWPCKPLTEDLGGMNLKAGIYCFSSSAQLTGTLILSGSGPWIFQIGSQLTTASDSAVNVIDASQACNVFWQVGSSAVLGTTTHFVGTIMALTSITLANGANIVPGRALARNGDVTLDTNTITAPTGCNAAASPTTSPTVSPSASATAATVQGLPTTGGGPQSGVPWVLVLIAGIGTVSLGLSLRAHRRRL